jgi:ATP-dependent Clp protease ATP-binding subunit ClpB
LDKLLEDRGITLDLDNKAQAWLADTGYDPVYGARPLKRVIQRSLQNSLAGMILKGGIKDGGTAKVSSDKDGLTINGKKAVSG